MKKLPILLLALLFSVPIVSAQTIIRSGTGSPEYDKEPIYKAIAEVKDLVSNSAPQTAAPEQLSLVTASLSHIEMLVNRGFPLNQISPLVRRLLILSAEPKFVSAVDALALKIQAVQETAQIKAGKEIQESHLKWNSAIDQALKTALATQDAKVVGQLIADLRSLQLQDGSRNFNPPRSQTVLRFLGEWQSMLTLVQEDRTSEAVSALYNMSRNYISELAPIITAEQINARRQKLLNAYEAKTAEAVTRLSKELFSASTVAETRLHLRELEGLRNQVQNFRTDALPRDISTRINALNENANRWVAFVEQRERNEWREALSNLDQIMRSGKSDEALLKTIEKERANLLKTAAEASETFLKLVQEKLPKIQAGNTFERADFSRFKSVLSQTEGNDAILLRIAEAEVVLPAWTDILQAELSGDGERMASALTRIARVKKIEQPLIPAALIAEKMKLALKMTGRSVDPVAAAEAPTEEALSKRILEIQTPAQLGQLTKELTPLSATRNDSANYALQALVSQLENLRNLWVSGHAVSLTRSGMEFGRSGQGWCRDAVDTLQKRIVVQTAATTLKLPQLTEASLADQTLPEALNKLAAEFAEKAEWRKTYDILQFLDSNNPMGWPPGGGHRHRGIASYLAGLNFEMAEQWPQAVQSYHDVLRSVAGLNPTKEAAERLKALRREHPEAFEAKPVEKQP